MEVLRWWLMTYVHFVVECVDPLLHLVVDAFLVAVRPFYVVLVHAASGLIIVLSNGVALTSLDYVGEWMERKMREHVD